MPKRGELTPAQKRAAAGGGTAAVALAALISILPVWEGKQNTPYFDSVHVRTVCYGETRGVQERRYSDAECLDQLRRRGAEFLEGVRRRNPRLVEDPYQWAAHASMAYNNGLDRYNSSGVARLYEQGREIEACHFMGRYRLAGGRVLMGLVFRREGDATRLGEIELCLTPHPSLGRIGAPS